MTELLESARAWISEDPDPDTRAELTAVVDAAAAGDDVALADLEDRFRGPLEFGTAGLRGAMGAGPNRMNRVVVIRAAAGLAAYLRARGGGRVLIGADARRNSDVFATDTAHVLAGAGLEPLVITRPLPTPLLAYGIRSLGCVAGVMVTASHNPPQDNGYKVYLGDGSQIVPPADSDISAAIVAVGPLESVRRGTAWTEIGDSLVESYLSRIASTVSADGPRELRMAYTPLHGVGWALVREALPRVGFALPEVVAEQVTPDPAFPTVTFPNPEEPGAMDLALALGERISADLVVANDPDADRCAVAVPVGSGFRMLTGDELGALLASHLLASGAAGTFATTIVSSTLLGKIAAKHGQPYVETLTGFKWIGRVPGLAFGYEEALGYCVDPVAVADKDGVSTLVRVAELAASLRASGRTLLDLLDDLAREYGVHATSQLSVRVTDLESIGQTLAHLEASPPSSLGGRAVERIDDLAAPAGPLPPTPGLRFTLEGNARVVVRPSGTEPKLKCYLEVVEFVADDLAAARSAAAEGLAAIRADLEKLVG